MFLEVGALPFVTNIYISIQIIVQKYWNIYYIDTYDYYEQIDLLIRTFPKSFILCFQMREIVFIMWTVSQVFSSVVPSILLMCFA